MSQSLAAADAAVEPLDTATQHLDLRVTRSQPWPGTTLCSVVGEVDAFTADQLRTHLFEALATARPMLVIDLSGLRFLGVAGLRVLLQAQYSTERTQQLRLVTGVRCVDRLLQITGHEATFDVYPSLDAALASAW